jgi:hypothetical protein
MIYLAGLAIQWGSEKFLRVVELYGRKPLTSGLFVKSLKVMVAG